MPELGAARATVPPELSELGGELERVADGLATLAIHDDGIGGADPARGSGLVGLSDRIETLGSRFEVISLAGARTTLLIEIPPRMRSDVGPSAG
jgi:signal transduction histidine kinase